MNKKELVNQTARKVGLPIAETKEVIDAFLDVLADDFARMKANERLNIKGFGTFILKERFQYGNKLKSVSFIFSKMCRKKLYKYEK